MKLVLLGTTGYHPSERRQTTCVMIPEMGVVFDAGTAMFRVRDLLQTSTLDIFLTHAHLDHVVGLTFLLDVLWGKSIERVTVHAERDKIQALNQHLFAPELFPSEPPFLWSDMPPKMQFDNGAVLSSFPLTHPGGSIGFRMEREGRSLAFVTDTTANEDADYLPHIRDVDLLIHECYFPVGWESHARDTGHSSLLPVARLAAAANAKSTVLIHLNPLSTSDDDFDLQAARKICPSIELGYDGQQLDW